MPGQPNTRARRAAGAPRAAPRSAARGRRARRPRPAPTGGTSRPRPDGAGGGDAQAPAAALAPPADREPLRRARRRGSRGFACRSACGAAGAARPGVARARPRPQPRAASTRWSSSAPTGDADDASVAPRRGAPALARSRACRAPRSTGPVVVVARATARARPRRPPRWRSSRAAPRCRPASIDAEVQGHKVFFGAERPAELSYVVGGSQPANVAGRAGPRRPTARSIAQWAPGAVAPGVAADRPVGRHRRRQGRSATGVYQFRVTATDRGDRRCAPPARQSERRRRPAGTRRPRGARRVHVPALPLPDRGAHDYGEARRASAAGAATRARTSSPPAARRSSPPAAASCSSSSSTRARATTSSSTATRTGIDFGYMHLREAALVQRGRPRQDGPARSASSATPAARRLPPALRGVDGAGLVQRRRAFDPLPDLRAWDAQSWDHDRSRSC